jgi:LacI family sucrose operon transcriptional repressor
MLQSRDRNHRLGLEDGQYTNYFYCMLDCMPGELTTIDAKIYDRLKGKEDEMASINDVAKKAGVAKSTVSLVINNKGSVSEVTKQKVVKAMEELNYVPSQLASNLSKQRSNIVGIIVPNIMHPFFATFVNEAEKYLNAKGYMTMVTGTVGREEIEKKYLKLLEKRAMDGIIMGVHSLDMSEYRTIDRPIVSLDRYINAKIPVVTSDHEQAAKLVADFLREKKCKKVIQFVGTKNIPLAANDFSEFVKFNLSKQGIKVESMEIGFNTFGIDKYEEAAKKLFDNYREFDTVIGVDMVVASVLKIARQRNIRIPEDLQIIAYDGTYVTNIGDNDLTSVVQPIGQLAYHAVETMIKIIEGETVENKLMKLAVSIREGNTTRKR